MSHLSLIRKNYFDLFARWRLDPSSLWESDAIEILTDCLHGSHPEYRFSRQGIEIAVGEGDNRKFQSLTDTLFLPCGEIRQHRSSGISRKIHIMGIRNMVLLEPVILSPAEFSSMKWIREKWGFKVWISPIISNAAQYIQDIIYRINEFVPYVDEYCSLGWIKDSNGQSKYITGTNIIGEHNADHVVIDDSLKEFHLKTTDISEKNAFKFVLNTMLPIAPIEISNTALSFMLLSLMTSVFKDWRYKPDFVYYLFGESGSRKTSISKLFFNMYEQYADAVPINFKATGPAMEQMMVNMRDTVTLIDDIAPSISSAERHETEKKLENIVRAYGDSVGRQKMESKNKTVHMKPGGLAAITAEDNVFKSLSSLARCFMIPIRKEDINLERLTAAQGNRTYFPTAIRFYLQAITENFEKHVDHLKQAFLSSKDFFTNAHPDSHGRLITTASWLDASFNAYMNYGLQVGFLTLHDFDLRMDENRSMLLQWIQDQNLYLKRNNEVDMFIHALAQLITSNRAHIPEITVEGRQNKIIDAPGIKSLIGYRDFSNLYLLPDLAYSEVRSFYGRLGIEFPVSKRSLIDRLFMRGILKPDNNKDGTKTVRIKVNGQRVSVIRLDLDAFRWWDEEE
ncbi:hypothetical protein [Paenibacillus sp. UNC451MF]|uniref:hypothetical protein n=1 Tax=Paenibacillus sp. UNC451MF TaxID=1449063 RepID=UPI000AF153F6|nr:hypothetical protein [Paenibacillus sp. UNC451MF]